jgi:hypothetical protein
MCIHEIPARAVIHWRVQQNLQILNQGAVEPDIESLNAVTDRQDRLVKVECILQEKLVSSSAAWVRRSTFRNSRLPVALRIDIESTSGKKNALCSGE